MRIHGFFGLVLICILVMSSGCINPQSEPPETTPTISQVAIDLHMTGFRASVDGDYETALDYYDQSIAADPTFTRVYIDKGNVLIRLNRTEEAIMAYDSALARVNDLPKVWNSRGEALMTIGKYSEALASFDTAISLSPDYQTAKENRNRALEKLK